MADKGFDGVPRTAFLLTGTRLPDGVMFAISADYRSREPVRFQVWRPTDDYSTFTLVWEYRYESPVVGVRHDVSHLSVCRITSAVIDIDAISLFVCTIL